MSAAATSRRTIKPRASQEAVTAVYLDLADKVEKTALAFCRRYAVRDREETLAMSRLFFVEAYHTHQSGKGNLAARVTEYVWGRLLDNLEVACDRAARLPRVPMSAASPTTQFALPFEPTDLALSADALFLVRTLFHPPADLEAEFRNDPRPIAIRAALRRRVRAEMGWTAARAARAFANVAAALSLEDE